MRVDRNQRGRLLGFVLLVALMVLLFNSLGSLGSRDQLSYTEFKDAVDQGRVAQVVFTG